MRSLSEGALGKLILGLTLSALGLVASCAKPQEPTLRDELTRSVGAENVENFFFSTREDGQQTVAALTSAAVRDVIAWDDSQSNLPLRYTLVRDAGSGTATTFKTEIAASEADTALVASDLATGEVVQRIPFPTPEPEEAAGGNGTFKDLQECIADFNCKQGAELRCEANRTCKEIAAHLICCLDNGNCIALVLLIKPTDLRCKLHAALFDQDLWVAVE